MYRVEITNKGEYSFNVKSKDYEFMMDVKGAGMTPPDTLLASLGGCIGVYLRKYAEGTRLDLGEFRVTVDGELRKEPPVAFDEIKIKIDFMNAKLDERKEKAIKEFIKNCPVHNTLENSPRVTIEMAK